jgi:uncharacterized membrane protein YsdA (DUF1294 family)/cold shock CspA family protein
MHGIVVHYNSEKGYGFIDSKEHSEDIFVHHSKIKNTSSLSQGQEVEFDITTSSKGISAINVIAGSKQHSPYLIFGIVSALLTISIFAILYLYSHINPIISYLIAINITTFFLYGYDKIIASTERLRVPENNLHALAILGGSPAGLSAQKFFRHKTIKGSFQLVYWIIVFGQIGLIYWLK